MVNRPPTLKRNEELIMTEVQITEKVLTSLEVAEMVKDKEVTTEIVVVHEQKVLGKDFKVYGTKEEPLFLARQVAEWIEYSKTSQGYYNVSKMLMTVDDDEKLTITNSNSGGSKAFLTEDGLYEVLMQSRKPIAKAFKKQVKSILKEIRLTGAYVALQFNVPKTNLQMMQAVINEQVRQEQLLMEQKQELEEVGNRLDSVEGVQSVLSVGFGNDWRNTANKVITRIGKETGDYRKGWNEVYEMLDARGFRVATRAKNATEREGRKVSKLDIIERDKKLKTAFIESVRAVAINNHVDTSDLI